MSTTITIPTVELKSVTRALASDWAPTLHATARRIAVVVALFITAWVMASEAWQRLVAWAQACHLEALARLGLPGSSYPGFPDNSTDRPAPVGNVKALLTGSPAVTIEVIDCRPGLCQRLAPALPPARSIGMAKPSIQHLAAEGFSQREIAGKLGISRYQVRKALARA